MDLLKKEKKELLTCIEFHCKVTIPSLGLSPLFFRLCP